jgi:hypothetical protein
MLAALVSAFVASTSSRDLVAVIESKIVERGCLSFHPFEYGFALSEVETTYESHLYGGRGARGLLLKPHGGGKDIGILLERSQYLDNLFQTFPTAMKIYVDNFRNNRVLRPPQQRALAASKRHETEVPQR